MPLLKIKSASEQVAEHLRTELLRGVWSGTMPGEDKLVASLGVGRDTVKLALRYLEEEGLIISQGKGRRRLIALAKVGQTKPSLRVAILLSSPEERRLNFIVDLQHLFTESGHTVIFPELTMSELGMNVERVAKLDELIKPDAWVVVAGSRDVLEWFAEQPVPTFALFGLRRGLKIPSIGPDKETAYREVTRRLLELGHRRIVLLTRPARRLPVPGLPESGFLEELELAGIQTSSYHLPDWDGSIESLHDRLDLMFRISPPTAMIIDEPLLYFSVKEYLSHQGILSPEHVSLICTDGDPYFDWQRPTVAHIHWDIGPCIRRVARWANSVAMGKNDIKQTLVKTTFFEGGSVRPLLLR
jgi:LacI family transcriptional regulator